MRAPCRPRGCAAAGCVLLAVWSFLRNERWEGHDDEAAATATGGGTRGNHGGRAESRRSLLCGGAGGQGTAAPPLVEQLVELEQWAAMSLQERQAAAEEAAWSRLVDTGITDVELRQTLATRDQPPEIPVVILAGHRHEYLQQTLASLDTHRRLVVVSFNTAVAAKHRLTRSFDAARCVKHLRILPLRVQLDCGDCEAHRPGNAFAKRVWVLSMRQVWKTLVGYSGDVVFLEDDLRVAPDFYAAVAAASRIKSSASSQLFAMGGWAGINTKLPDPHHFILKTWSAVPTMGYGFVRTPPTRRPHVLPVSAVRDI
jgi:hypothetical protein